MPTSAPDTLHETPESIHLQFRAAMAQVCTPVSIVTTMSADGPFGTTVSAFNSLSMNPPMIMVALDKASDLLAAIEGQTSFAVNVLAAGQGDLGLSFARKGGTSKFDGIDWSVEAGNPCLPGVSAFLSAQASQFVDGGDHIIVLGEIEYARTSPALPLTYHARSFGTHTSTAPTPMPYENSAR